MASVPVTIPRGRVKAPWMGIPVPGERPVIVWTEQLRLALAGKITITDAAITEVIPADRRESCRALEITYRHGSKGRPKGNGRIVIYDRCRDIHAQRLLTSKVHEWAELQRKNRSKRQYGDGSARAQKIGAQIRRLEKEKGKLYLNVPWHPLLPSRSERYQGDHYRNAEWDWHVEKPQRKRLAKIAGMVIKNRITGTTAYKMLREIPVEFRKFSELRTHDRERRPYADDYWKHVHEFCLGMAIDAGRDSYGGPPDAEDFKRHAEARVEYLRNARELESLNSQIAELQRMAAGK